MAEVSSAHAAGLHARPGYFRDRVILVTGGGAGIGRAVAVAFAKEGAKVVVADMDADLAKETCALGKQCHPATAEAEPGRATKRARSSSSSSSDGYDIPREKPPLVPFLCDVADMLQVEEMVEFTVQTFGGLHHCVNNAGMEGRRARLHEQRLDDFTRVISVNVGGLFNCMKQELKQMMQQRAENPRGEEDSSCYAPKAIDREGLTIVNMGSTAGQAAMPEFAPYCASKHAVIGLTRSAAKEYACDGIRINCVCPSTTATPMVERFSRNWPDWQAKQNASFPTGRVGTAEEVAAAVLWLSSPACPMACGTCLTIDGALTA